jgi:hypothetical protein
LVQVSRRRARPGALLAPTKIFVRRQGVGGRLRQLRRVPDTKREGIEHMADRPEDVGNGVLLRNDRREKPSHPEFKGEATIEGKKYWVAAWVKEKDGKKFFSLAFRPKGEPVKTKPAVSGRFDAPLEDFVPF